MKRNIFSARAIRLLSLSIFIICVSCLEARTQTTAFTYQGRLTDSSSSATGSYLMRFELFAATGETPIDTLSDVPVSVSNNVFTVQLNFTAANAFDGTDRFLQISIRRTASESYTTLTPRQPVTSAPYSIRAKTASDALAVGGTAANQIIKEGDFRLINERAPTTGSPNYIQNTTTQQTADFNISGNGIVGGKVGIGTTTAPTTVSLQVNGGILARGGTPGANGASNNGFAFGDNDGSGMFSTADGTLQFYTSSEERIRITRSIDLTAGNGVSVSSGGNGGAGAGITLQAGGGGSSSGIFSGGNGGAGASILLQAGNGGSGFSGGGAGAGVTLQAGNGGSGNFSGGTGAGITLQAGNGGAANSGGAGAGITLRAGNGGNGSINSGGNGASITLQPGGGGESGFNGQDGVSGNVILAPTNGNVGIGTTSPTSKLYVVGNFNVTGNGTVSGILSGNIFNATTQFNIGGSRVLSVAGTNNIFAGVDAGLSNTSGSGNSFFGGNAGNNNTIGGNNTVIGFDADVSSNNLNYATALGAGASVSTSNTIALGRTNGADKVRIFGLGAAGSTSLCRNANNEISTCTLGNFAERNQIEIEQMSALREQVKRQQIVIDGLKKLLCASNKQAEVCREEK